MREEVFQDRYVLCDHAEEVFELLLLVQRPFAADDDLSHASLISAFEFLQSAVRTLDVRRADLQLLDILLESSLALVSCV